MIDLYRNNVGDEGAQDIAQAIKYNSTLKEMKLLENSIGFDILNEINICLKKKT